MGLLGLSFLFFLFFVYLDKLRIKKKTERVANDGKRGKSSAWNGVFFFGDGNGLSQERVESDPFLNDNNGADWYGE